MHSDLKKLQVAESLSSETMSGTFFNSQNLLDTACTPGVISACLAVLAVVLLVYRKGGKKYRLPPGPSGLPILGYLPFLGPEPYKELDRLKRIYGNVFSIYMGRTRVVILADFEAVKDAFSKSTTTDRPEKLFDALPDEVGFSSVNGEEWVEQRKFCLKSMREYGIGKDKWESIIQMEVEDFVKIISSYNGEAFKCFRIVTSSVSNNISSFVFGKRLPFDHPDRKFLDGAMERIMLSFSQSSILRFFPVIQHIAVPLGIGNIAEERKQAVTFNNFFRREVKKIKETYKNGEQDNFIVDYLKEMDQHKGKTGHYFHERNLYGNLQALFLGGSDTTRNSILWLILAMARFPDIQAKVQQEVDSVLGEDELIRWSDRMKVPYTYATIMEGQRWRTLAPLNTARIAMEDIQVQGYDIPKGTTIIANNWGINYDPQYWKEPEKFNPGRFLSDDGKQVLMRPDSYVPFSYGKRNCPGEVIAFMEILIYFTAMIRKFTISALEGKEINLDGKLGLTYHPYEQELHFVPRT